MKFILPGFFLTSALVAASAATAIAQEHPLPEAYTIQAPGTSFSLGTVMTIDAASRLIVIKDKKGKEQTFTITDKTKFKADKTTGLAGKKDIGLTDLKPGDTIEIAHEEKVFFASRLWLRVRKPDEKQ